VDFLTLQKELYDRTEYATIDALMSAGWGSKRKLVYIIAAIFIVLTALVAFYVFFFNQAPSCMDGKQDGNETGIDCGGPCTSICSNQAHSPTVLWSRAFPVATTTDGSSLYTAAAYVQNANVGAGAKNIHYSFQLFDSNNALILERTGVTDLPPVQTIPIVETGINVGTRTVARTLFSFSEVPEWHIVPAGTLPALALSSETLASDGTRLSATITNNSLFSIKNLTAVAVVFDANNNALAASKSVVSQLASHASQNIVFTWPTVITGVSHAEITLLPSF